MDFITITPEQLETMIRNAVSKALDLRTTPSELPDRCTFKKALEITGLSKSALYKNGIGQCGCSYMDDSRFTHGDSSGSQ